MEEVERPEAERLRPADADVKEFCRQVIKLLEAEQITLDHINQRLDAIDRTMFSLFMRLNQIRTNPNG
jgi:hypothetical protein